MNGNVRETMAHTCSRECHKAKWGKSDSSQANVKTAEPLVNSRKLAFIIGKERKAHHFRRSPEYAGDLYKANLPPGFRDIQ